MLTNCSWLALVVIVASALAAPSDYGCEFDLHRGEALQQDTDRWVHESASD